MQARRRPYIQFPVSNDATRDGKRIDALIQALGNYDSNVRKNAVQLLFQLSRRPEHLVYEQKGSLLAGNRYLFMAQNETRYHEQNTKRNQVAQNKLGNMSAVM